MKNLITFIALLLTLTSCNDTKWAIRKTAKIEYRAPEFLPKYCSTRFPVLSFDSVRTEYIEGESIVAFDTVTRIDTFMKYVDRYITKTIKKTDTFRAESKRTEESSAKLTELKIKTDKEVGDLKVEKDSLKSSNDKFKVTNKWLWYLVIILGGYLLVKNILRIIFPTFGSFLKYLP